MRSKKRIDTSMNPRDKSGEEKFEQTTTNEIGLRIVDAE